MGTKNVKYLLIGGGVASVKASMGIRELDKDGSVLIVRAEESMPYDRPPLSKGILLEQMQPDDAESKYPVYYTDNHIDLLLGTRAESVSLPDRSVTLSNGDVVKYEKLLFATGSRPRQPKIDGIHLQGVHLLREMPDSLAIRDHMKAAKKAVMVGAGYIGMEVGSDCLAKGIEVEFVDPVDHPWGRLVSPLAGNFLRREFEKQGARFYMGEQVEAILGENHVDGVRLKTGQVLAANMVIVGVGIERNLELPRAAGLKMDERHGVEVDHTLRTSDPNVWAAGDIAAFIDPVAEQRWHHEHHLNADWQGMQAGRNMAGADEPYDKVAYFFSDMGDLHMALRGCPNLGESVRVIGDVDRGEFVELYAREDATLCMGIVFSHDEKKLDPASDKLEEALQKRAPAESLHEAQVDFYLS